MTFSHPSWRGWRGPSADPNDEQFGDVTEATTLDAVRESPDRATRYDVVLVGEPYDGAVIGRKGASEGPLAIRESLAGVKTCHFESGPIGVESGALGAIADLGDVEAARDPPGDVAAVQRAVRDAAAAVHDADALPVFLGGDNSLTFANAEPLLSDARLGAVNFDAHLDVREVRESPTSGTPYRQLFEAGLDAYVCVGARHFETSTSYVEYVASHHGAVVTAEAVRADLDTALERARAAVGGVDVLYVSVDADVLDATAAPGVSAPTPGGLSTREVFAFLRRFAAAERDRIAGFEVVECAPPLDVDGRTADAAARAVAHFLSGYGTKGEKP